MEKTEIFKETIHNYLKEVSLKDKLFKAKFENPKKNIDDCITYILNTVEATKCNGFADSEIFNMALHYYDEKDVEIGEKIDMRVVVNHTVKLTEEEIEEAKKKATQDIINEQRNKMVKKEPKKIVIEKVTEQPQQSLF